MDLISYSYEDVPTIGRYAVDDTLIRSVMGPMGSGKSVGAGVMEVYQKALRQAPGPDGVRRSRWAVVRNTTPQLIDTTIKTWLEWLPDGVFGDYKENPRPQYIMNKVLPADGIPVHAEVMFRALDKPDQLRDLLSLELTGCWFNEVREMAHPIFNFMRGRINRYPAEKDGGPTWTGIFCDTNACDTDHWFYEFFEIEKPTKCSTCKTERGGMILYPSRDSNNNILPIDKRFCPQCGADYTHSLPLTKLFRQPSARSPRAENLKNLSKDYYAVLMMGQPLDFIKVYVDGEWGYVGEGKWVYLNWISQLHIAEKPIAVVKQLPLIIGLDFGLNPAAAICQSLPDGRFNIIDEVVGKDIIFREFLVRMLKPYLKDKYLGMEVVITGDPSGVQRQQTDGNTCFRELKTQGLSGIPAPTNTLPARLAAVNSLLTRPMKNMGSPDKPDMKMPFQVSPKCVVLIRGFNGAYHRRRVAIVGKDIFKDEPEKTFESHCFIAGTKIATEFGNKTIEDIQVEERVLTPLGLRSVLKSWKTQDHADLVEIILSDGRKLTGTPNHPFYVRNKDLTRMDTLQYNDILECISLQGGVKWIIRYLWSLMVENIVSLTETIIGLRTGAKADRLTFTGLYGNFIQIKQYLRGFMSTIKTRILSIMNFQTLNLSPIGDTYLNTELVTIKPIQNVEEVLRPHRTQQGRGINRIMGEYGTESTQKKCGKHIHYLQSPVKFAEPRDRPHFRHEPDGVVQNVNLKHAECGETITFKGFVSFARALLRQTNILKLKRAPVVAQVNAKAEQKPAYNLTIENNHVYFANGILVHNCHDALQYAALTAESGAIRIKTRSSSDRPQQTAPPVGAYT